MHHGQGGLSRHLAENQQRAIMVEEIGIRV